MVGLSNKVRYGSALSAARGAQLALFLGSGALVLVGMEIGLAALIERTSTAHAVTNMVNVPAIFLSDLFLPAAPFPPWMQGVVKFSPIYPFVQALRQSYAGQMAIGTCMSCGCHDGDRLRAADPVGAPFLLDARAGRLSRHRWLIRECNELR